MRKFEVLVDEIQRLQKDGLEVAIELPREGYWIQAGDELKVSPDGALWWSTPGKLLIIPEDVPVYLRTAKQ